ncbi:hypothetical protein Psuf_093890 [Phytohabitans suffuscus]|uniref:ChsH2 rubredoxin-like zinc ribbon domain-containing protein n=1 Tax=Phytohabitans suffuscus TaxID=624315 RepID=A0A6F8Z174_9ACTN|nr:hypothetical protein Psuf_093890 [Phytohabitans suffuscus]
MLTADPTYWPQPEVSGETRPFWEACGRGEFLLQRCDGCGKFQYPYRGFCCHCWAGQPRDVPSTGRGTVWSYSVVRRNRSRDTAPSRTSSWSSSWRRASGSSPT